MKTVLVKNISLQFDLFNENASEKDVYDVLNAINECLQERMNTVSPQMFVNAISVDDIEIANENDCGDTKEEKITQIKDIIEKWGDTTSCELELESSPCINSIGTNKSNVSILIEGFHLDHVSTITYQNEDELGYDDYEYEDLSDDVIDEIYDIMEYYDVLMDKTYKRIED